jgi:hypothetical protein
VFSGKRELLRVDHRSIVGSGAVLSRPWKSATT